VRVQREGRDVLRAQQRGGSFEVGKRLRARGLLYAEGIAARRLSD
jgi:hypothetical protein